jgi:hypothetical protein
MLFHFTFIHIYVIIKKVLGDEDMASYESMCCDIVYLLNDSYIDDEYTLEMIKKLKEIVTNYMAYKYVDKNLDRGELTNLYSLIDTKIKEYLSDREDTLDRLDGYLPSCGSITLDVLNYKINSLEQLKKELPYTLEQLIILLSNNCNLEKEKMFNEFYKESYGKPSRLFFQERSYIRKYDRELLKKYASILFDKKTFEKFKKAISIHNDINRLKNENNNMKLFIQFYDLIEKRSRLLSSISLIDNKILNISKDDIDPLAEKLSFLTTGKIKPVINTWSIKSKTVKLDNLTALTNDLFGKRTKRQHCVNKIDAYLEEHGLKSVCIPRFLYSKRQYRYLIEQNNEDLTKKDIEYTKYLESLDDETRNILLNNFDMISNVINMFGLDNKSYIMFYITYMLEIMDEFEINDDFNDKELRVYLSNVLEKLNSECTKHIQEIDNYKLDTKKLTKKIG